MPPAAATTLTTTTTHHPYLADLYTFDWSQTCLRNSAISTIAPLGLLLAGVLSGTPASGLIAGGGAVTIGFGINQRIADSRLAPMLAASFAMAISTFVGMWGGHHGYTLLLTSALWAFAYGLLTAKAAGISWVGQQAAITLFVASAFPADPHAALVRSSLVLAGGAVQILVTTFAHRIFPELWANLFNVPRTGLTHLNRREILHALHHLPDAIPRISHASSFAYATRLAATVVLSAELYRRLDIQSGYWIPMTALLVQKPVFSETLSRALLRILGTLAGAVLCTQLLAFLQPDPIWLAILTAFFAFLSFLTVAVNYGLFSLCITSYIVFLLSLYTMPVPLIAHRRALCTLAGGLIALIVHADQLLRHRRQQRTVNATDSSPV